VHDDINVVTLSGNITRDPEFKVLPNGTGLLKASIAMNKSFKSGDEWKKTVQFVNFDVFGKYAEVLSKHVKKGASVTIVGELRIAVVDSDGAKKTFTSVNVSSLKINKKGGVGDGINSEQAPDNTQHSDEVPF
jgi:single-strand DNA-binding protein